MSELPELKTLEQVLSQYDFILNEGIVYTKKEKEKAKYFVSRLNSIINELPTR